MMNLWKERLATKERNRILGVYKKCISLSGIFLILLLVVEIFAGAFFREKTIPDSAWTITLNGKDRNLTSGSALIPSPKRGDVLTCTALLPDVGFSYPALIFEPTRSHISVTCGDSEIYSSEDNWQGTTRPIVDQISLKDIDFSQPVTISFEILESNSVSSVPTIIYTEQSNAFAAFVKSRGITFVISLFLFFVGVIGSIICSASIVLGNKLKQLIYISQFTFWSSLCMFNHLGFILIFIPNETINSLLELASLYLAFIFACQVIYPKLLSSRKHRRQFREMTFVYLGCCLLSLLLPLFTNLHIMDTFFVTVIILAVSIIYSMYHCIRQWILLPERMSFPVTGFMILFGYAVFEELRIILHAAGISILGTPELIILNAGILIFTASSLIDYFMWFKKSTIQETVEESWKRFSEPNSEPGISGYQKTLALLSELQESKSQYTIATVSIDNVEELKKCVTPFPVLEDNFARLLYLVFGSYGITGNLGNGKYLLALPDMPEGKMKLLLRAFKELVKRDNENHPDAKIVFSAGYALSSDTEDEEITRICQLANNSRKVQEQQLLE